MTPVASAWWVHLEVGRVNLTITGVVASPSSSKDWDAGDDERALKRSDWPLPPAIDDRQRAVITLEVVQPERLPECFSGNLRETWVELVLERARDNDGNSSNYIAQKEEQILAPKCAPA
ncbi:hypothetical protein ACO22_01983 [Paracoccidioides brasiliensis]|uniref:Uncharacterized protein n=1 Tax=Paracoccidioides brasiliensis TaxID=121759 RepID=A0A1D2JK06_PARBR|nr:hypothetical protein ACO22_01983 [Paracoccidioides brasiliensis]